MSKCLLIRITPDGSLVWHLPATSARGESAPPADIVAAADEVRVLVPVEDVLLAHVELPQIGTAKLLRVLPFALEDQVLDAVESLHFALGPALQDGRHAIAVVACDKLDGWLARLREAGVVADVLLPDALALPLDGEAATLLLEDGRGVVRLGTTQGFACDAEQLPAWLAASGNVTRLHSHSVSAARPIGLPAAIAVDLHDEVDALGLFADSVGTGAVINLLQGNYAPRHRHAPQRRLWRTAAMLALAAIVLGFAGRVVDVLRMQHASRVADDAIAAIYARSFPDSPAVPDPVARMQSELQRLGGGPRGAGMMPLLARVTPLIVSQDQRLRVQGLEYRGGTLELAVHAPSLETLDQLRERIATIDGLDAELVAATPGSDGVEGRLRVHGGGA